MMTALFTPTYCLCHHKCICGLIKSIIIPFGDITEYGNIQVGDEYFLESVHQWNI